MVEGWSPVDVARPRDLDDFSPNVAFALRETARRLTRGHRSVFDLYDDVRTTMCTLWPVRSFSIGRIYPDNVMIFSYNYHDGRHLSPDFEIFSGDSLTSWLMRHKRTCQYQGRVPTGQSNSTVVVPLLDRGNGGPRVIGSIMMRGLRPGAFDDQAIAALEWMSGRLAEVIARDDNGRNRAESAEQPNRLVDLITHFSRDLQRLTDSVDTIIRSDAGPHGQAGANLRAFQTLCRETNVRAIELLARRTADAQRSLDQLTPQEKVIAQLIAHGMSNREVAKQLHISEATAKTHTSRILKKFGARQRCQIAARISGVANDPVEATA